MKENELLRER